MPTGHVRKAHDMAAQEYIREAATWARFLVDKESRCHGDKENAVVRVSRKFGKNAAKIASLVKRPQTLKSLCVSVFVLLRQAYLAECERQGRKLLDEANKTAEVIGADHPLVLKAQALADKAIDGGGR
jgi:hypothetical protein